MGACAVAARAGRDLVLDPRRPALQTRDDVLGRRAHEPSVERAPAPDAGAAVTLEGRLEPLGAAAAVGARGRRVAPGRPPVAHGATPAVSRRRSRARARARSSRTSGASTTKAATGAAAQAA